MLNAVHRRYRLQVLVLMAIYMVVLLLVWPYARHSSNVSLRAVLTVLPTLPVMAVLWLMAARIMQSDELQQRVHLIALSVATGIVSALSLVGGFLCATHVVTLDGDVLIWVFPALCLVYAFTRWFVGRRYGGVGCE